MQLKVVLAAYVHGLVSSRAIARACREHVTFIALSGDEEGEHIVIAAVENPEFQGADLRSIVPTTHS